MVFLHVHLYVEDRGRGGREGRRREGGREEGFTCECVWVIVGRNERMMQFKFCNHDLMRSYSILLTYTLTHLYHSTPSHKQSPHVLLPHTDTLLHTIHSYALYTHSPSTFPES